MPQIHPPASRDRIKIIDYAIRQLAETEETAYLTAAIASLFIGDAKRTKMNGLYEFLRKVDETIYGGIGATFLVYSHLNQSNMQEIWGVGTVRIQKMPTTKAEWKNSLSRHANAISDAIFKSEEGIDIQDVFKILGLEVPEFMAAQAA